ncbi:flagellar hook-length control protein FliK [Cytobacillus eiseniae]|uniref:Flagellar hook-length control protein FliK n=1 Tax=Cytobacillus eiseniae TaxID=762947 RepID=A0ABS4RB56_9BACI|nr:flagellar hook-length control protein FliK [Cytobacillus eiseniae]
MDISSIGAINTLISSEVKIGGTGKNSNSFSSLLSNLVSDSPITTQPNSVNEESNELTGEELAGLVQFLQINDILELENGMELLGKTAFQSNTDIISLIEEELNISSEGLLQLLTTIYNHFATDEMKQNEWVGNGEVTPAEENHLEAILSIIQAISVMQTKETSIVMDKELAQGLKALKLYDLLAANQDSFGSETRLKELLKNINEKFELKLNGQTSANREEYLQKTFHTLVQEMSSKNPILGTEAKVEQPSQVLNKTDNIHNGFIQFQQMSKPEQLTLMTSTQRPVSAEQLMEQFESILSRSKFSVNGGTQRLFIKLNPEHLGALRIELIQKDSMMVARILTSTSLAREMMESQLNGLKQAFSSQNIQIERVEISQQFTGQERTFNREQQQGQERQQPREEQKEQQANEHFTKSFEEALLNTEA